MVTIQTTVMRFLVEVHLEFERVLRASEWDDWRACSWPLEYSLNTNNSEPFGLCH